MPKQLRDVEISPPNFHTLEEALEYSQRFQDPQFFEIPETSRTPIR